MDGLAAASVHLTYKMAFILEITAARMNGGDELSGKRFLERTHFPETSASILSVNKEVRVNCISMRICVEFFGAKIRGYSNKFCAFFPALSSICQNGRKRYVCRVNLCLASCIMLYHV